MPNEFSNLKELISYLNAMENRVTALEVENHALKESINAANIGKVSALTKYLDENLPHTGLLSRSFMTRAFTVWGHYFVAQLIVGAVVGIVYAIIVAVIMFGAGGGG